MAIPNVNQITADLRMKSDQGLQEYAALNKNNPYIMSLAVAESNDRKALRASQQAQMAGQKQPTVVEQSVAQMAPQDMLPEEQGIGALPAPNMQNMADGGIAGYAMGGDLDYNPYYSDGGTAMEDEEDSLNMAGGGVTRFNKGGLAQYQDQIVAEANRLGIDPQVALNLFRTESGGNKDAVSPKGAAGLGQLMKPAAQEMGLSEEERFDPQKNIRASLGYFKKQLIRFGDYEKAAAAYNWGPGNVNKHLKKNDGFLDRLSLPKETANYLTKLMPGSNAVAGELPRQAAPQAQATPQAAPQTKAAPQAQATPQAAPQTKAAPQAQATPAEPRAITGNQAVIGAGETALQYLTGLAAMPTAGGAAVLGQVPNILSGKGADRAEMERSFREKAGQVTYEPRTEGGRAVSEGFAKTLEDLKIPPYLAHMGNLSPTRGRKGIPAAELEALAKTKEMEAAAAAAKTQNLRVEPPRKETPSSFTVDREGRAIPTDTLNRGLNQRADIDAAAKAASEAKAWRDTVLSGKASQGTESTRPEVIARNAALARAQGIAAATSPAAVAGTGVQPSPNGETALEKVMGDDQYNPDVKQGPIPKVDAPAAAAAAPAEKKSRFTDDDLLMLGLGMMANNKPGTGNTFGDLLASAGAAGIGALQNKREREKLEMDTSYKDILGKYYGSLGKKAEADAAYLESGEKTRAVDRQKALMLVDSGMENWMKTLEGSMPKAGEAAAKRAELTRYYFGGFGLPIPDTMAASTPGAGFKVIGSRPS